MKIISTLLGIYLSDARTQLAELNERFSTEVDLSSRPFVEDALGAFAASLDVLEITRQELSTSPPDQPGSAALAFDSEVISILSVEGEFEFVSESIEKTLGYTREELVGSQSFDLVHPEDLPEVQRRFEEASIEGRRVANLRYRYRHKDGSWRVVMTHLQCIRHKRHTGLVAHSYVSAEETT